MRILVYRKINFLHFELLTLILDCIFLTVAHTFPSFLQLFVKYVESISVYIRGLTNFLKPENTEEDLLSI